MWWVIWSLLVLGAVAVFVLIGLRLWRSVRALLRELNTSAADLGRLAERIEELSAAQEQRQFRADLNATTAQREQWRETRTTNLSRRAQRRYERRERAYQRWRAIGMSL